MLKKKKKTVKRLSQNKWKSINFQENMKENETKLF